SRQNQTGGSRVDDAKHFHAPDLVGTQDAKLNGHHVLIVRQFKLDFESPHRLFPLGNHGRDLYSSTTASTSSSRMMRMLPSLASLYSSPAQAVNRMVSPTLTCKACREPSLSALPAPTARILPFCGFSLALSGSRM